MSTETEIKRINARLNNLEEVVKKLLTLYSNFASNKEVQELTTVLSSDIQSIKNEVDSAVNRLAILEDIPDIDF